MDGIFSWRRLICAMRDKLVLYLRKFEEKTPFLKVFGPKHKGESGNSKWNHSIN